MNTDTSEKPVFRNLKKTSMLISSIATSSSRTVSSSIISCCFFHFWNNASSYCCTFIGIKWLWLAVAYVIFHAVISEKIRDKLDGKFIDEHPVEAIAHFGR